MNYVSDSNHGTRWTVEEDDFLTSQWDGRGSTTEVIAEILGRTANACSQRYYEISWGVASDPAY